VEYTVVDFEGGLGDNGGKKSEEDKDVHIVNESVPSGAKEAKTNTTKSKSVIQFLEQSP